MLTSWALRTCTTIKNSIIPGKRQVWSSEKSLSATSENPKSQTPFKTRSWKVLLVSRIVEMIVFSNSVLSEDKTYWREKMEIRKGGCFSKLRAFTKAEEKLLTYEHAWISTHEYPTKSSCVRGFCKVLHRFHFCRQKHMETMEKRFASILLELKIQDLLLHHYSLFMKKKRQKLCSKFIYTVQKTYLYLFLMLNRT